MKRTQPPSNHRRTRRSTRTRATLARATSKGWRGLWNTSMNKLDIGSHYGPRQHWLIVVLCPTVGISFFPPSVGYRRLFHVQFPIATCRPARSSILNGYPENNLDPFQRSIILPWRWNTFRSLCSPFSLSLPSLSLFPNHSTLPVTKRYIGQKKEKKRRKEREERK